MTATDLRDQLVQACLAKEVIGVRYAEHDGTQCALVGRPVSVSAQHVMFVISKSDRAIPISIILDVERDRELLLRNSDT